MVSKVAEELTDVAFFYVDVDQSPELAERFGISGIPALVQIKKGNETNRLVGFVPEQQVRAFAQS